jgi:hypothetical protein
MSFPFDASIQMFPSLTANAMRFPSDEYATSLTFSLDKKVIDEIVPTL